LERARAGCAEIALELPQGAPARRVMSRILAVPDPTRALAFLEATGVTSIVAPGAHPVHAARIQRLPVEPAIRWAAWLRGSSTARAMVSFRMPHALARRIERVQASHPLDRMEGHDREAGLRRLTSRLEPALIDALITWRRIELEAAPDPEATRLAHARLDAIEVGIARQRARADEDDRRRHLALDGEDVMHRLQAGPGRHVGAALGHLAEIVAADPEANTRERLEQALEAWAKQHPELLDRARSAGRGAIG
jgi:hypothetical protein